MEDKDKCPGALCSLNICCAENGYKICCCYKGADSLSQRAGWVPCSMECKDYVEKNEDAVVERVKKIMKCKCGNC